MSVVGLELTMEVQHLSSADLDLDRSVQSTSIVLTFEKSQKLSFPHYHEALIESFQLVVPRLHEFWNPTFSPIARMI